MIKLRNIRIGLLTATTMVASVAGAIEGTSVTADVARQKLLDGNKHFVEAKLLHPDQSAERRTEVAKGQHPFAAVVSCSDSRVPPEIIFDQGVGDLFVVRLAGNILDDAAIGSLEYAVEHLGVSAIVVLGHERCGAVEATLKGGEAPGHIGSLTHAIQPAVEKTKGLPGDALDNAVRANVANGVELLKESAPILKEAVEKHHLTVIGARYDLDDGAVTFLP